MERDYSLAHASGNLKFLQAIRNFMRLILLYHSNPRGKEAVVQLRHLRVPCEETSLPRNLPSVLSAPAQLLKISTGQSSSAPAAALAVGTPHAHTLPLILVPPPLLSQFVLPVNDKCTAAPEKKKITSVYLMGESSKI